MLARQSDHPQIPIRQKAPADRLIHHPNLLEKLGILTPKFPIILVGGTNGKGSTTHLIGRIFLEAGYKVGINTSPHLVKFNERVRINEIPISEAALDFYLTKINQDFSDFPLGYNEYSFLTGLYAFIHEKVDLAVFEIGLGGRFDPANLLNAQISVITNIDLDHTEILGDSIEKIAAEKAGIIKSKQPLICGQIPCPLAIQGKAKEKAAPLYLLGKDFSFEKFQKIYDLDSPHILPCNAALGIQTALLAREFLPIPRNSSSFLNQKLKDTPDPLLTQTLKQAIKNTYVPGRLQTLPWKHPLLLDVCHNPGGVEILKNYLLSHPVPGKNYAIFAVSETKDCQSMLQIISPVIHRWILPNIKDLKSPETLMPSLIQALTPDETSNLAQEFNSKNHASTENLPLSIPPSIVESKIDKNLKDTPLKDILRFLESELVYGDRLIVFGSFYLGGELLCALSANS